MIIYLGAVPFRGEVESVRAGCARKFGVGSSARSARTIVGFVVGLTLRTDKPVVEFEAVRPQEVTVISVCNVVEAGITLRRRTLTNSGCGVEHRLVADF